MKWKIVNFETEKHCLYTGNEGEKDLGFCSGVVTKMWLAFTQCDAISNFSYPHGLNSKAGCPCFKGWWHGLTGLEMHCRVMGLPPSLSAHSFSEHN